jgi:hypothetical protein
MATTARGQGTISVLDKLADRYALLAAKRAADDPGCGQPRHSMPPEHQMELDKLIQVAEQAAEYEINPVVALVEVIKAVSAGNADPYLVMGVLVEGTVQTLRGRVPHDRRSDTAMAALKLMADRMRGLD